MKYPAYFIGGPIDGQERLLATDTDQVSLRDSSFTYRLLFAFGEKHTLIYTTLTLDEAMGKLWECYHESICGNHNKAYD